MPLHPEFLWAQRSSATDPEKNILYLTVNLPDIREQTLKVDLTSTRFSFSAQTGDKERGIEEKVWEAQVEFYDEIDPDNSKKSLNSRSYTLILRKKTAQAEYWPRLTKEKAKLNFVKTDFSKWVDEDEQDGVIDVPDEDTGDFGGMGGMGGMGGLGGMGGMGGLGGLGGAGGLGGSPDFAKMMESMGSNPGFGGAGVSPDEDDEDDEGNEGPPPLEADEAPADK